MPSAHPIRRRTAAVAGLVAFALSSSLAVVGAPAVHAAPTFPVGGLLPSPALSVAAAAAPLAAPTALAAALPASVDLTQWAVPAGDQGYIGSCASWSVGYTISGWYARKQGQSGNPFAPMFLYSQLTGGKGGPTVGTSFYGNLNLEQTGGIDPLADFTQGNYTPSALPSAAQKTNALNYKITGWSALYWSPTQAASTGQQAIMTALAAGKPVALGMKVYSNFFSVGAANDHYDAVSGSVAGGHAVAVLAYDSFGVKIENSWGQGWGNQGFAWLSWNFIANQTFEAYSVDGFSAPAAASGPSISDLSATSGSWSGGNTVTVTGTNLTGTKIYFGTVVSPTVVVAANGLSAVATVPAGLPGAVGVYASTVAGGKSNSMAYTYTAAVPTITSVAPTTVSSAGGTTVTIQGTNLAQLAGKPYSVLFNGVASPSITVASDGRSVAAVAPAGKIGPAGIKVVDFGGTSAPVAFTYAWPEAPVLTLTAPATTLAPGTVALAGAVKNSKGVGYSGVLVTLQSRAAGTTAAFANLATATTATNGTFSFSRAVTASTDLRIVVINDIVSPALTLTIVPPPSVVGISAASGSRNGGQTITLTGAYLKNATVTVGGTASRSVVVNAAGTSLTFITPARPLGAAAVIVTTPTGASKPLNFVYKA